MSVLANLPLIALLSEHFAKQKMHLMYCLYKMGLFGQIAKHSAFSVIFRNNRIQKHNLRLNGFNRYIYIYFFLSL